MPVQVAVVGCGNFARYIHLPNLKSLPQYDVRLVADTDPTRAFDAAEKFGVPAYTSDYESVLADPEIDLVIITTPHSTHGSMALQAVNARKSVLVEKPMTLTLEEIPALVEAVQRTGVTFTVGFNRRYSELSKKAKSLLHERKYPLLIHYRMMNQIIHHPWALNPNIGGGRLVCEGVHLLDYCAFLVGAEPVSIYAEGGNYTHPEIVETDDNAVIAVRFDDGSIANIVIGDLGSDSYPKERVEMFPGEHTILIDDYLRMETRGYDPETNIELAAADKGFVQELVELAEAVTEGRPAPVTEIDGARATLCAIRARESLRTGQPQRLDLGSCIGGT